MILNKTYMTTGITLNIHRSQRHSDNIGTGALRIEGRSSLNTEQSLFHKSIHYQHFLG